MSAADWGDKNIGRTHYYRISLSYLPVCHHGQFRLQISGFQCAICFFRGKLQCLGKVKLDLCPLPMCLCHHEPNRHKTVISHGVPPSDTKLLLAYIKRYILLPLDFSAPLICCRKEIPICFNPITPDQNRGRKQGLGRAGSSPPISISIQHRNTSHSPRILGCLSSRSMTVSKNTQNRVWTRDYQLMHIFFPVSDWRCCLHPGDESPLQSHCRYWFNDHHHCRESPTRRPILAIQLHIPPECGRVKDRKG